MILNGRYFIDDPEFGYYEVDKEEYERYKKRMDEIMNMFMVTTDQSKVRKGSIVVTSTLGDENPDNELKSLWHKNKFQQYNKTGKL